MLRHEVAIYAPLSGQWYERTGGRGGGAERQMMLLARALSSRGVRVAHIVFEPHDPVALPPHLTLVRRGGDSGKSSLAGGLQEAARIWRALSVAGGRVMIVRQATPAVGITALFCKLRRRRMIFSSASDRDFIPEEAVDRFPTRALYRLGLRLADMVVVQSREQESLARGGSLGLREVVHIPSFCEAPDVPEDGRHEPGPFLWVGRLEGDKALRYVDLARALPGARFTMIPIPITGRKPILARKGTREALVALETTDVYRELREAAHGVRNLEFCEPRPHPELMDLISRAAAVVNTSTFEGMPNVFLEAWARGVPVLTLNCDPDGVIGRRGLGIAAGGSWDRFVAGARELWDERSRRAEPSRRTRAYIDEVHSIEAVAARWADVIDGLGSAA